MRQLYDLCINLLVEIRLVYPLDISVSEAIAPLKHVIKLLHSAVLGLGQVPPKVDDERRSETYKDEQQFRAEIGLVRVELEKTQCLLARNRC